MKEDAIRLEGISHRFENRVLFSNLNATFQAKRITSLLGKSGSGKSTLLQMINGLIKPDEGSVSLSGNPLDYASIHQTRRQIGYVIQQVGLFPHLTAYRNILLPGAIAGQNKATTQARATMLMELVGLSPAHRHKYPHELSGGEQQRVGLCRAILLNPPFMLLDEPFSALDVDTKNRIHEEVLHIQQQEPRCIVLVTHDHQEAKKLGDVHLRISNATLVRAT